MKCPSPLVPFLAALALAPLASTSSHPPRDVLSRPSRLTKVTRTPHGTFEDLVEREQGSDLAIREGDEMHSLSKRGGFSGRATYFAVGLGACGATSSDSDFIVAMNTAQYGDSGAISSLCFQTITISYGGKSTQATVMDACPTCPYGGIDMSPGLFQYFASESVGVIYVQWSVGSGEAATTTTQAATTTHKPSPTTTWTPPTTSASKTSSTPSSVASSLHSALSPSSARNATLSTSASNALSSAADAASLLPIAPASEMVGGNLDTVQQLLVQLGSLVGTAAQEAA